MLLKISDLKISDLKISDLKISDLNISDLNISDLNISDLNKKIKTISFFKFSRRQRDIHPCPHRIWECTNCPHWVYPRYL